MEPVTRARGVSADFGQWVERRRRQLAAQLAAAEESRWDDLARLIGEDATDGDPPPHEGAHHADARALLEEAAELTRRLATARLRALDEMSAVDASVSVERHLGGLVAGPGEAPGAPDRRRGDRLDGYL